MKKTTHGLVWWMRPIYELFFATPCKHPNFWGVSGGYNIGVCNRIKGVEYDKFQGALRYPEYALHFGVGNQF